MACEVLKDQWTYSDNLENINECKDFKLDCYNKTDEQD
jgi:hypothetical protein